MRRYLIILLTLAMAAGLISFWPAANAQAQSQINTCGSLRLFEQGCRTPGGTWSPVFTEYATAHSIPTNIPVGAQVQFFPQGQQPLEKVMYIVGPYLPTDPTQPPKFNTVAAERTQIRSLIPSMSKIEEKVAANDASILYIGFARDIDSQQPVAQRVEATKAAIMSFEQVRRTTLGRNGHATALMGLSLGGVVGKIALTELEAEGFDHDVNTYFSFDSPHWGAYTPPAIQQIPKFMHDAFNWADAQWSNSAAEEAQAAANEILSETLRNPVAQDLMIINLAYSDWQSPNAAYVRDRKEKLPTQTERNVAIASGAIDGTRPTLQDSYFDFDTGYSKSKHGIKVKMKIQSNVPTLQAPGTFYGYFKIKRGLFSKSTKRSPVTIHEDYIDIETGPCAHSTEIVDQIEDGLNREFPSTFPGFSTKAIEKKACFIPTWSALAGFRGQTGYSPFDLVIGDEENKEHLHIGGPMETQIHNEINRVFMSSPNPAPAPDPNPAPDPAVPTGVCDFWSGTHSLDETLAMFPEKCGEPWNDQIHTCEYTDQGWHCKNIGRPASNSGQTVAPVNSDSQSVLDVGGVHHVPGPEPESESGVCDFWSGTHNLDETRAMFPEKCGLAWNDQVHKCEYTDDGWHCQNIW